MSSRELLKEMSDEDLVGLLSTAVEPDRSRSAAAPKSALPYAALGLHQRAPRPAAAVPARSMPPGLTGAFDRPASSVRDLDANYAHVLATPFSSPNRPEKVLPAPLPAREGPCNSPQAQRSLFSHTEEVSAHDTQDNLQHAAPNKQEQRDHLQRIAALETSLKVSLESQEALRDQCAKDKGLWEKCELDLKACQLLLERERQERKQEQEDMEREMQQALRAVGEKAVHFVEEEIMRFNSTALELDSKLRQAEKQRDEAVSALSRANGVGQQHCNECRLRGLARHLFEKTIDGLLSRALTSWRQVVLSSPSRDKNVDVGGHAHRQDIKTQVPETPPKLMYGLIASAMPSPGSPEREIRVVGAAWGGSDGSNGSSSEASVGRSVDQIRRAAFSNDRTLMHL